MRNLGKQVQSASNGSNNQALNNTPRTRVTRNDHNTKQQPTQNCKYHQSQTSSTTARGNNKAIIMHQAITMHQALLTSIHRIINKKSMATKAQAKGRKKEKTVLFCKKTTNRVFLT